MANDEQAIERRSLLPVVVLALLTILYLASLGPMIGLAGHGVLSDSAYESIVWTVYFPLAYLEQRTGFFATPVGDAYLWYIELFEP